MSTSLASIHCFNTTLEDNVIFLTQKNMAHDTCVK
jgi:hypothetical protein